ncbi:MAG: LodA/GoxA family CTQ-dependent oxidase [Zavarzinella sp.]
MSKTYKIHPAIGFARVGTSGEYFNGPEIPGEFAQPNNGSYRDANKELCRQACTFKIFEYDETQNQPELIEVGGTIQKIEWSVHLMNKKAVWYQFAGVVGEGPTGYPANHPLRNAAITNPAERIKKLIIDPLQRTIIADGSPASHEIERGTSTIPGNETWPPVFTGGKRIDSLGTLFVNLKGFLTVAGGYGKSGTPGPLPPNGQLNYDNNDNWFDDTSDGSVTAKLHVSDGTTIQVDAPAWLIVGPPDYAPPIENLVTVYDLLYDLALRKLGLDATIYNGAFVGGAGGYRPSFTKDIYPILRRALDYRFVIKSASPHHSGGNFDIVSLASPPAPGEDPTSNIRSDIFDRLRDPDNLNGPGSKNMPRLHNDGVDQNPPQPETRKFTITRFQYFAMKQWAAGWFVSDWTTPAPVPALTPTGMDQAAMEAACGGSFFPGMEGSWILRDPRIYHTPFDFRFKHLSIEGVDGVTPGDVTKRMALPWQADFLKCGDSWWPAQRPNQVKRGSSSQEWASGILNHVQLVDVWSQLGIVAPDPSNPGEYIETERTLP